MRLEDFDFPFPESQIALYPLPRGQSRLLAARRDAAAGPPIETATARLGDFLAPGDALVLNDTRVLPARLLGRSGTGAKVEALLLRPEPVPEGARESVWTCMLRPAKRCPPGKRLVFGEGPGALGAVALERAADGTARLAFAAAPETFPARLAAVGKVPLPPYIRREAEAGDEDRYQSVFAAHPGSVAAPTASLHLTAEQLADLEGRGVRIAKVTLHVGAGTFRPVQSPVIEAHAMHSEWFRLPEAAAEAVNRAKAEGRRIFAVGTTVARVLESRAGADGMVAPGEGETDIFIYPGYRWKCVDALMTNFHWPKSTLFMLVCSLLGVERARAIYADAIAAGFRLFSYGDAMLIY